MNAVLVAAFKPPSNGATLQGVIHKRNFGQNPSSLLCYVNFPPFSCLYCIFGQVHTPYAACKNQLLTSNFYSMLYYNSDIWHSPHLGTKIIWCQHQRWRWHLSTSIWVQAQKTIFLALFCLLFVPFLRLSFKKHEKGIF